MTSHPALQPTPVPRPQWSAVPRPGCRNVDGMLLVRNERIAIALLRFGEQGTIDEHAADHDIDVVCVHGRGHVSVGAAQAPFGEGERVRWPAGEPHRLWTEDSRMTTLMVEYPGAEPHGTPTAPNAVRR